MIHTHPHPGEMLKEMVLDPLGLTVSQAAEMLSMSRSALSRVVNGKAGISPDLAIRLEQAGESTARMWLTVQTNYELWKAMQHKQPKVKILREAAGGGGHTFLTPKV